MKIDINKVVILGSDEKYLVIDKVESEGNTYYYVAEINESETDIRDNYKIMMLEKEEDQNCFKEVLGEEKLKNILPLFLNNIKD